jgi:hypothetical protein
MGSEEVGEGKLVFGTGSSSARSRREEVVPFEMGNSVVQHGIIYRGHMAGRPIQSEIPDSTIKLPKQNPNVGFVTIYTFIK